MLETPSLKIEFTFTPDAPAISTNTTAVTKIVPIMPNTIPRVPNNPFLLPCASNSPIKAKQRPR